MMYRLFDRLPSFGSYAKRLTNRSEQGMVWGIRPFLWFFFQPSKWQTYLQQRVGLEMGQCLLTLDGQQWRQGRLLKHLFYWLLLGPATDGTLMTLLLWMINTNHGNPTLGITLAVFLGIVFALFVSLESGMTVGLCYILLLVPLTVAESLQMFDIVISLRFGWLVGLTAAVACGTAVQVQRHNSRYTFSRQAGGMIIGIFLSGLVFWLAVKTSNQIILYWQGGRLTSFSTSFITGIVPAIILIIAATIRAGSLQRGSLAGLGIGFVLIFLTFIFLQDASFGTAITGITFRNMNLVVVTAVFLFLFILPFVMANWLGGVWAGGVAGGFAVLAFHIAYGQIFSFYQATENLLLAVALVIAGLTLIWWRPFLTYPLQLAWNSIIFRIAESYPEKPEYWLHRHTVSWDEGQYLPLTDLPHFLLYTIAHAPEAGHTLLDHVSQTAQNWASIQVQIELDALFLEQAATIEKIIGVQHQITAGLSEQPSSNLMQTFKYISQDIGAGLAQHSQYNKRLGLKAAASQLRNLVQELTRSSEQHAPRFRPIAIAWEKIVQVEIITLETIKLEKQEIDDPYIIGVPLTAQQEIFVGRADVSQKIEQLLLDKRRPPLLIYGQRRMGKTSLLNNLGRLLPRSFIPLFVDLQGPISFASNHAGLIYNLARSMQRSAYLQRNIQLPDLSRSVIEEDVFTLFDLWLDRIEDILLVDNKAQIILILDEFESLDEAFQTKRFDEKMILGTLRHIIQNRQRMKVLLAGSHTLAEFKRWSGYLLNAEIIHLSCLTLTESKTLIEQPIPNFKLQYAPGTTSYIYELTAGHPFLLQLLCSEIIAVKNNQSPTKKWLVTLPDIEQSIPKALKRGSLFFADIEINQLGVSAAHFLCILAKYGQGTIFTKSSMSKEIEDSKKLDDFISIYMLRELFVETVNGYHFKFELIRRWFDALYVN